MDALLIVSIVLAVIVLPPAYLVLYPLVQPTTPAWWILKIFASALSPFLFLAALLSAHTGVMSFYPWLCLPGIMCALVFLVHMVLVSRKTSFSANMTAAFGTAWREHILHAQKDNFLTGRSLLLPKSPEAIVTKDICFHTYQKNNRPLLCDVWQPAAGTPRSGLAFVYLHGSAWVVLDKDAGTRPFFRHLASQGHVIMDVAYRLFPETDMMGMIHDTKHAVAWMRSHASDYRIDPDRIALGGGSAGGHIALMAAFTTDNVEFTPADLLADTAVCAVVSLYGPTDLKALYYHTAQHVIPRNKTAQFAAMPAWIQNRMGQNFHRLKMDATAQPGILPPILGGYPEDMPEEYERFSPVAHVHNAGPPVLMIQGDHDIITDVNATLLMQQRLKEAGVPAVLQVLPQTDHAFDLILPRISPSAHTAYYEIERFLCVVANTRKHVNHFQKEPAQAY